MRSAALPALVASLALWAGTAAPAFAQATTGTGGGPTSTVTAPNTSATGRTMPPAATAGEPRGKRTQEQKVDDKITRGICIGCGPK